jgi:peptidyl-prolyl cis-trans isomerase B (cyclophilin B)
MRRVVLSLLFASISMLAVAQSPNDSLSTITQGHVRVKIETPLGDIAVRLYDATPLHRDNFVRLVKEGYYDNTLFHRVIKGFMIQGGDPNSKGAPADAVLGSGGPGYTLEAEIRDGLYHKRGALAAAREPDDVNPERRSGGSQFYIVWGRTYSPRQMEYLVDKMRMEHPETGGLNATQQHIYATYGGTPHLDGEYTVFGEVEQGLDVIEKIQASPTTPANRPIADIAVKMTLLP